MRDDADRKNHSEYKKGYTGKVLVAMSPGGHISFVSNAYPGSIDDASISTLSGFIELLSQVSAIL